MVENYEIQRFRYEFGNILPLQIYILNISIIQNDDNIYIINLPEESIKSQNPFAIEINEETDDTTTEASSKSSSSQKSIVTIIFCIVGGIVALVGFITLGIYIYRRRKGNNGQQPNSFPQDISENNLNLDNNPITINQLNQMNIKELTFVFNSINFKPIKLRKHGNQKLKDLANSYFETIMLSDSIGKNKFCFLCEGVDFGVSSEEFIESKFNDEKKVYQVIIIDTDEKTTYLLNNENLANESGLKEKIITFNFNIPTLQSVKIKIQGDKNLKELAKQYLKKIGKPELIEEQNIHFMCEGKYFGLVSEELVGIEFKNEKKEYQVVICDVNDKIN